MCACSTHICIKFLIVPVTILLKSIAIIDTDTAEKSIADNDIDRLLLHKSIAIPIPSCGRRLHTRLHERRIDLTYRLRFNVNWVAIISCDNKTANIYVKTTQFIQTL